MNCFWKFAEKYEEEANPTMSATSFTLNCPEARSSAALLSLLRRMYSLMFSPVLLLIFLKSVEFEILRADERSLMLSVLSDILSSMTE